MYRPHKPLGFEPANPEHSLVDAFTYEIHSLEGPEIVYWKVKTHTEVDTARQEADPNASSYLDDLDQTYGEKSSDIGKLEFYDPVKISGKLDSSPILHELLRLGLITKHEIDLYINIAHATDTLDGPPRMGDVFRITYMIRDKNGDLQEYLVYYKVSTINPVDLYNYQYINYQINAEQTDMADVPASILEYYNN